MKNNLLNKLFGTISACMNPVIPLLMAGGIIKMLVILFNYTGLFKIFPDTELILTVISNAVFYFLPFFVAYSSACHFNTNRLFAMAAAGVLLLPDFIRLMEQKEAVHFLFLPVYKTTYAYSVLPIMLLVYILSILTARLEKIKSKVFQSFFLPVTVILAISLVGILIVGPAGSLIGKGLSTFVFILQDYFPVLSWAVFAACVPFFITTGTNWIFTAIILETLGRTGIDIGYMVGFFIADLALVGACFGTFIKEKSSPDRASYLSSGMVTLFAGISEPILYGICIPKKYPLVTAMIGSFLGGIYQGVFRPVSTAYAFPSLPTILMFHQDKNPANLLHVITAAGIGFISSLVLTITVKSFLDILNARRVQAEN